MSDTNNLSKIAVPILPLGRGGDFFYRAIQNEDFLKKHHLTILLGPWSSGYAERTIYVLTVLQMTTRLQIRFCWH